LTGRHGGYADYGGGDDDVANTHGGAASPGDGDGDIFREPEFALPRQDGEAGDDEDCREDYHTVTEILDESMVSQDTGMIRRNRLEGACCEAYVPVCAARS